MCCCHGRGRSWRIGVMAAVCEDGTQIARGRFPTPTWQTVGKGLFWAWGCSPFPQTGDIRQTEF